MPVNRFSTLIKSSDTDAKLYRNIETLYLYKEAAVDSAHFFRRILASTILQM